MNDWRRLSHPRKRMVLDGAEPEVVAGNARVLGTTARPDPLLFPLRGPIEEDHQ